MAETRLEETMRIIHNAGTERVVDVPGSLLDSVDHLATNRTEVDVLYELLLKRGIANVQSL